MTSIVAALYNLAAVQRATALTITLYNMVTADFPPSTTSLLLLLPPCGMGKGAAMGYLMPYEPAPCLQLLPPPQAPFTTKFNHTSAVIPITPPDS